MLNSRPLFPLLVFCFFLLSRVAAQDSTSLHQHDSVLNRNLTISYAVELISDEKNKGLGETYNGGLKTVFISGKNARVRLVSLMRIQSIYLLPHADTRGEAVIVKESGKNKYRTFLSGKDWKSYNSKYDSATCMLTTDSVTILGYPCRKALVNLQDKRVITVYYTDSLYNPVFSTVDPAFKCIPGVVLKYEYSYKKGTISYTATSISTDRVTPDVFKIPSQGYAIRKFSDAKSTD